MSTLTTGRTLDADGEPIPGTGFELRRDGDLAALLARRTGPLTSHPTRPVWSARLEPPADDPEAIRSVSVMGAGYEGPPEHYHQRSRERFEVRDGTVTYRIDGERRRADAGETVVVETGQRHTFAVGDRRSHVLTDITSPGRLRDVLPTLGGIAHDPETDAADPLQRAIIADRLADNTVFTETDPRLTRPLVRALAPLARLRGYEGAYAKYRQRAFWERHVEQPDL